jgi:hypothetical protein
MIHTGTSKSISGRNKMDFPYGMFESQELPRQDGDDVKLVVYPHEIGNLVKLRVNDPKRGM